MNKIERLRALKELQEAFDSQPQGTIAKLKRIRRIMKLREKLGMANSVQEPHREHIAASYEYEDKTLGQRQKDNDAAYALLKAIEDDTVQKPLTKEQKDILAKFSGSGGNMIDPATKLKGSAYEYYTPKPIVDGVWDALKDAGFNGGKVLDPSCGTGIFASSAPDNAVVEGVELNPVSGTISGLLNDKPGFRTTVSNFESFAASTDDEVYDAIVTNVPFGSESARGANKYDDRRYQKQPLQNYFILRSLEKLKPGGLAAFIVPHGIMSGKDAKNRELRHLASLKAEFRAAFRLPSHVFHTAGADVITDVVIFRKYGRDVGEKIGALNEAAAFDVLRRSNVLWDTLIDGDYFKEEGKKFVLGEFKPKDPDKFRDVDRVLSNASIQEVSELIRKVPKGSRIDYAVLEAAEVTPIVYNDGDTIISGGITLQMKNGKWEPIESDNGINDVMFDALFAGITKSPYNAWAEKYGPEKIKAVYEGAKQRSMLRDVPDWFTALAKTDDLSEGHIVAMAVQDTIDATLGEVEGYNFAKELPELTKAMLDHFAGTSDRGVHAMVKRAVKTMKLHAAKGELSAVWKGSTASTIARDLSADQAFEGMRYKNKTAWVNIEDAKRIYGESFDLKDDAWCIDGNGNVCRADDYFVGRPDKLMAKLDAEISAAEGETKAKLEAMLAEGTKRLVGVNLKRLRFDLNTPYISADDKVAFLQGFIDSGVKVEPVGNGKYVPVIDVKTGSKRTDNDRIHSALNHYMKEGTVRLGSNQYSANYGESAVERKQNAINAVKAEINRLNVQFDLWVRSHTALMSRLEAKFSNLSSKRFRSDSDETPINIDGMNPGRKLHGYQNAFVRQMSRGFEGINGMGVGLGKTFSSLAAVQYAQSIGVKRKTIFIVPNSVLSNWQKEVKASYDTETADQCLYVGLREIRGKMKANSKYYDEDLLKILENKHSKIFMTYEAFERIRIREQTAKKYVEFMSKVDSAFRESERAAANETKKGKEQGVVNLLTDKIGAAPYIEDMGIDSIVVDEAHNFKNAASVFRFKGAKYLSLSAASRRGLDMMAKTWFIRDNHDDGVLLLTATPITNSPLEIYSMMSIAIGSDRVLSTMSVDSIDDMMETVCDKDSIEDTTIDGRLEMTEVFIGLKNVETIRSLIHNNSYIKNAEDVGMEIVLPDEMDQVEKVQLSGESENRLNDYKLAYQYARMMTKGKDVFVNDDHRAHAAQVFDRMQAELNEDIAVIAHPFNLLTKMTTAMLDTDLDKVSTRYIVAEGRDELIKAWNAKPPKEVRERLGRFGTEGNHKTISRTDEDGNQLKPRHEVTVYAYADGAKDVLLDTASPEHQEAFEKLAESLGIELDVTMSPKIAAFLDSFKREEAMPRGIDDTGEKTDVVRQIVFCDTLGALNKIKRLITKHAKVPASEIAIVTGRTNNKPEDIQAVQDGFNATGEDRKFRTILANEKAEVGINLQRGTQAIHHLTIGWTPDSLVQRNGRGVRQGNQTQAVSVYYYDANGTFDEQKRAIVNSKANWIDGVMSKDDQSDRVKIEGMIGEDEMDALINNMGDADAIQKMQAEIAEKKEAQYQQRIRAQQETAINTIQSSNAHINAIHDIWDYVRSELDPIAGLLASQQATQDKIGKTKSEKNHARLKDQINGTKDEILKRCKNVLKRCGIDMSQDDIAERFGGLIDGSPTSRKMNARYVQKILGLDSAILADDAPIMNEHKGTIEHAKLMIEEAKKTFKSLSSENGAISETMLDTMVNGNSMSINGKKAYPGMVITSDQAEGILTNGLGVLGIMKGSGKADVLLNYEIGKLKNVRVFFTSEPQARPVIEALAALEDENESAASRQWNGSLASTLIADVLAARKVAPTIWLDPKQIVLKGVDFPLIFTRKYYGDLNRSLTSDEAAKSVKEVNNNGLVSLHDGVEYESIQPGMLASLIRAQMNKLHGDGFAKFAKALSDDRVVQYPYGMAAKILIERGTFDREEILKGADEDGASLTGDVRNIAERALGGHADRFLVSHVADAAIKAMPDLQKDYEKRHAAKMAQREEEKAEKFTGENAWLLEAARSDEVRYALLGADETKTVYVIGNTYHHKDEIKSYANTRDPSGAHGAKWDGINKRWAVSIGSMKALHKDKPDVFKDIYLVHM